MYPNAPKLSGLAIAAALFVNACSGVEPSNNGDAERALSENQYRMARAHLAQIISSGSADQQTYLLQMELMLKTGDGHGAMAAIEKLSEATLAADDARIKKAHALILQDRPADAMALYEGLEPEDLSEQDFRMVLWALRNDDQDEEFTAGMDAGLEAFPDSADLNALAGFYLIDQGLAQEAQPYADRALEAAPLGYDALLLGGKLAIEKNRLEDAISFYQKAQQEYPTRPDPVANIAGLQLDLGRINAAGETIEAGLRNHPEHPFMLWQGARYALATDDLETARLSLEKARRSYRSNDEFTLFSARVEDRLGNRRLAISEYERYLRAVGEDSGVEARLSVLREEAGE